MDGPAALPRENGELVFAAPWEGRVFGLAIVVVRSLGLEWDEFRERLIAEIVENPERPYYEAWTAALEALVVDSGLIEGASLYERLQDFVGMEDRPPTVARDPVNLPMIRHLTDALGDRNPVYTDEEFAARSVHGGIVAPATSLQVWTMRGLAPLEQGAAPAPGPLALLDEAGFTSVVATNCEQDYRRYLRPGDLLTVSSQIESISELKKTALGDGHFVTSLQTYRDQHGEVVGEMRFRILKFKPPPKSPEKQQRPPPPHDSAFFWEGLERGELRIQRCDGCGALRHPPRPMCPACGSMESDSVVASGLGEVYSFVVHHHPPVPGRQMPFVVALVELAEGTRIVGNVIEVDPSDVRVGMPVTVAFVKNGGRTLPQWRPR